MRLALTILWFSVAGACGTGSSVGAEATNAPAARGAARATSARSMEYDAFRAIAEKNIFNSKRAGRSPGGNRETRKPARVDSLSLVGTMNYDQGPLAFFQGSDSDYRKALAPGARIAGYQVASVQARTVTLQNGTNSIELGLGMEMRREDGGSWKLSESPQPVLESSSGSAPSSGSDAGGEENEVLKKLRQKREKEMQ